MSEEYKGYIIKPHKAIPSLLTITYPGRGGGIPKILDQMYTGSDLAKYDIDKYLSEEKVSASKTRTTSGSK